MGRYVADPKHLMSATASKETVNIEQLAEVELNLLRLIEELSEKIAPKESEEGTKNSND